MSPDTRDSDVNGRTSTINDSPIKSEDHLVASSGNAMILVTDLFVIQLE